MTGKCRNCKWRDEETNNCMQKQSRCTGKCTISTGYGMSLKYMYEPLHINIGWKVV